MPTKICHFRNSRPQTTGVEQLGAIHVPVLHPEPLFLLQTFSADGTASGGPSESRGQYPDTLPVATPHCNIFAHRRACPRTFPPQLNPLLLSGLKRHKAAHPPPTKISRNNLKYPEINRNTGLFGPWGPRTLPRTLGVGARAFSVKISKNPDLLISTPSARKSACPP
jgi:hypothetical protein